MATWLNGISPLAPGHSPVRPLPPGRGFGTDTTWTPPKTPVDPKVQPPVVEPLPPKKKPPAPTPKKPSKPDNPLIGNIPELFQPNKYQSSSGYEGLPKAWRNRLAEGIIPELIKRAKALGGEINEFESGSLSEIGNQYAAGKQEYQSNVQKALAEITKYTKTAGINFQKQSRNALTGSMTGILNELANRNVLSSSVASDAISKAAAEIIPLYSQKGYEAAMQETQWRYGLNTQEAETLLKLVTSQATAEQGVRSTAMGQRAGLPVTLASIAQLSRYSESKSSNPLQPYQLLANFIMGY